MLMFNQKIASQDYAGAAQVAKDAPGTLLRNQETINKFKAHQQATKTTNGLKWIKELATEGITLNNHKQQCMLGVGGMCLHKKKKEVHIHICIHVYVCLCIPIFSQQGVIL